jgi:RHH-type proline utilization regulon transcriptional repressor/proline dehydrogenase/delta 1-pyrroline-5-carboxylate dehydrogenase
LSRLIVHEKVYDSFVERFVAATKSLRVGPAINPEYQVGPVIDEPTQRRINRLISQTQDRLKTLYLAENIPSEGYFVAPAIFELKSIDDPIFQEEIFGPVVGILKVKSLEEAFHAVNSVRFALTGGIYSRSPEAIERAKASMEVGNLYINRSITGAVVERQPFGGFKLSGVGSKAGGPDYLIQFMEPRTITENTVRRGFAADS